MANKSPRSHRFLSNVFLKNGNCSDVGLNKSCRVGTAHQFHSCRNASIGSSCAARIAG